MHRLPIQVSSTVIKDETLKIILHRIVCRKLLSSVTVTLLPYDAGNLENRVNKVNKKIL